MSLGLGRMDGAPVTRLSRSGRRISAIRAVFGLAWRSLLALSAMSFASSCIVADPPEYRDPVRTRPLLEVYKATPLISNIVVYIPNTPAINFSVPVRSEDAGEDLSAVTFVDYGTNVEKFVNIQTIAASTYDQSREIALKWTPTDEKCHVFSLIVAHSRSFQSTDGVHLDTDKAGDDAAIVSWWVNVNPPSNEVNTLRDCPRAGLPTL